MSVLSLEYINNSHVISVNCITQEFTWFTICILWCVFLQKIWTFWHILYWFRTRVQYAYYIHIIKQLFYIKPSFTFNPIFMFILGLWDIIYFHFLFCHILWAQLVRNFGWNAIQKAIKYTQINFRGNALSPARVSPTQKFNQKGTTHVFVLDIKTRSTITNFRFFQNNRKPPKIKWQQL